MFKKFREMLGGEKATEPSENSLGPGGELFTLIQRREELMNDRSERSSQEAKFEALFDLTKRIERLSEKR